MSIQSNAVKYQPNSSTVGKPAEGTKVTPVTVDTFNIRKFKMREIDPSSTINTSCKTQWMCFSDYDGKPFTFQTPEIKITQYGVPQLGPYIETEEKLLDAGISIPSDDQPGCMALKQKIFMPLDDLLKNKDTALGADIVKGSEIHYKEDDGTAVDIVYKYKPILTKPPRETPAKKAERERAWIAKKKDITKMIPRCDKWKVKLNIPYGSKKIETIVFVRDPDNMRAPPRKVVPANMAELLEVIPWGSTVQMIVQIKKLWADKAPMAGKNELQYGLTFKVMQILSTPRKAMASIRNDFSEYAFTDPIVEEHVEEKPKVEEKQEVEDGAASSSGETASSSGEEQEPAPKPEPVKPIPKQVQPQTKKPVNANAKPKSN